VSPGLDDGNLLGRLSSACALAARQTCLQVRCMLQAGVRLLHK
jgi:hypothetical protein